MDRRENNSHTVTLGRERLVFQENITISGDFTLSSQRFAESDIYSADWKLGPSGQTLSKYKVTNIAKPC